MNLGNLIKVAERRKKRLGLGHGSGRGKTAGRGTKGQKARGKVALTFEGGALPLIKRLPFRRGKGRNKAFKRKYFTINVGALNRFKKGAVVDIASLTKLNMVNKKAKLYGVKILGEGKLTIPLTVKIPLISKGAKTKIGKAGGKII